MQNACDVLHIFQTAEHQRRTALRLLLLDASVPLDASGTGNLRSRFVGNQ